MFKIGEFPPAHLKTFKWSFGRVLKNGKDSVNLASKIVFSQRDTCETILMEDSRCLLLTGYQ